MLFRLLCIAVLLLCGAVACQPAHQPEPPAAPSDTTATAPPDTTAIDPMAHMTDGGTVAMPAALQQELMQEDSLWAEALRIHYNAIVVDGHMDTPTLMVDEGYRIGTRNSSRTAHADLPRMTEGGLDAAFFSIYVAAGYGEGERAVARAQRLIAELKRQVAADTGRAALATSASQVRRLARTGKHAVLMGLEGGHATGGSPEALQQLYETGIRYITLNHVNTNSFADASQSPARWNGLNERGRTLVRAMNRLGLLVDLSHSSDSTFFDALAVSRAPVILSHSSARALVPTVRNASDAMLRALATNGGVILINFFDPLVNPHLTEDVFTEAHRRLDADGLTLRALWNPVYDIRRERGLGGARLDDVLDHIDHVVQVAGIDHVGLGSDFDGVFDLPEGLEDVTRLPWITYGLLRRGYAEEDLYKILGGNTLRVLQAAERVADSLKVER